MKNNSAEEWIYIGTEKEVKSEIILGHIEEEFKEDSFYIALERTTSKELKKTEIEAEIITRIGKEDFKISNLTFDKFIEFNRKLPPINKASYGTACQALKPMCIFSSVKLT